VNLNGESVVRGVPREQADSLIATSKSMTADFAHSRIGIIKGPYRLQQPSQSQAQVPAAAAPNPFIAAAAIPAQPLTMPDPAKGMAARDGAMSKLKDSLAGQAELGREVLDSVNEANAQTLHETGDLQVGDIKDNGKSAITDKLKGTAKERAEQEARNLRSRQKFGANYHELNETQQHDIDFEEMSLRAAGDGFFMFSLKQRAKQMEERWDKMMDNIEAWRKEQKIPSLEEAMTKLMNGDTDEPQAK
jgi:hypothetical protein